MEKQAIKWYLGGIWDGEGTFGIQKGEKYNQFYGFTGRKWLAYQPHAAITLCDSNAGEVFKLLEEEFGFACVARTNRQNPKWRTAHIWALSSQKACDFARAIEPYLIIKKERAQILMQWENKERGFHTMSDEERKRITDKQEELYQQMKILNKRGP